MDTVDVTLAEGEVLLERLLRDGVPLAHDCDGTLACASCHVVIHEGAAALAPPSEDELDMLDRAGADAAARLSCQVTGAARLVVELPRAGPSPSTEKCLPLTVTPSAAKHLRAQLARHPGAVAARLAVEPAGCSGHRYRVVPVEAIAKGDAVFECGGVRVAVDPLSLPFVQGTRIDLAQEGLARRLRFDNPNVRQSCGCGESFGV